MSFVRPVQQGIILLFYGHKTGSPLGQQFTFAALTPTILAQHTDQFHFLLHLDIEDMDMTSF